MNLLELIEELELEKQLYATWEIHIEYLIENNRHEEAHEQAKGLAILKRKIHEMEHAELTYK